MQLSVVYILTTKNHNVLYTEVTSNLVRWNYQHKTKFYKSFRARYNCDQLVYFKKFSGIILAIA